MKQEQLIFLLQILVTKELAQAEGNTMQDKIV